MPYRFRAPLELWFQSPDRHRFHRAAYPGQGSWLAGGYHMICLLLPGIRHSPCAPSPSCQFDGRLPALAGDGYRQNLGDPLGRPLLRAVVVA